MNSSLIGRVSVLLFVILLLGALSGCSTVEGLKESRGEGVNKTFSYDFEQVWNATTSSIKELQLPIVSAERTQNLGTVLVSTPMRYNSSGENVAVFVSPISDNETSVEVVSKKVLATNIFAIDWTNPILSKISFNLIALNKKPEIYLVRSAYDKLSPKLKDSLQGRYTVNYYNDNSIGIITERQMENLSKPGSNSGSETGSSLASAVYINNALPSGTYNMWTDIAVGVAGGVAGAGRNKAPVNLFLLKYTIRNLEGKLQSFTIYQPSPIGEPIGTCFSFETRESANESYCQGMTESEIKNKFLN